MLGYGANMTRGLYDDALRQALDTFLTANNIAYDQTQENGITPGLQQRLLTDSRLIAFSTPVPEEVKASATAAPGMMQKIRTHFAGSTQIAGLRIPTLVIWLVSIALITACILLAIHFFAPSDENSRQKGSSKETSRESNGLLGGNGKVDFLIQYGTGTERYSCDMQRSLKIGRNVGNFPLNMEDTRISRKHCEIYYSNRNLLLRDYSSNGTLINGKPCRHGEHVLSSGDELQIGQHKITIIF